VTFNYGSFDLSLTPSARIWRDRNLVLSRPIMEWFRDNFVPETTEEERRRAQVRAGRLAADGQRRRRSDLTRAALEQPERRVLAVVERRRVRMLGREAVLDADRAQAGRLRERLEARVLLVAPADRPTTAVDVQVDAGGLAVGPQHAQAQAAAA
jgi:hypothetical protein